MSCLICDRIELIRREENPYLVKELETGYVVIGDHQYFTGYTLFLFKEHITELHLIPQHLRDKHLSEMALVTEAVHKAFNADKINTELLGNGDSHVHWHIFPRRSGDLRDYSRGKNGGPVWWVPLDVMCAENTKPSEEELKRLTSHLRLEIDKLL